MWFGLKNARALVSVLLAVICFTLILTSDSRADEESFQELIITVGDASGNPGQQNSGITVFLTNVFDEVAAFELWLRVSRTDILEFQTELDTVVDTTYWNCIGGTWPNCTDSVATFADSFPDFSHIDTVEVFIGNIDTVGSLIGGWDMVLTRSITGTGNDIKITAQADRLSTPGSPPPIPTQGGGVLFTLLGDILNIPDTMTDRTVGIFVDPVLEYFSFSRPDGSSIGIVTENVLDTNYWMCNAWSPIDTTICLDWEKVPIGQCGGECDSISEDTIRVGYLDTIAVMLIDGSLTVNLPPPWVCGDLDDSGLIDIGDLTIMINSLFITLVDPADPLEKADVDCSGESPDPMIDIGDLTALIVTLFVTLEPLCCAP